MSENLVSKDGGKRERERERDDTAKRTHLIPKNSEVDAYTYIKEELEKLGWIVKNPARVPEGEVYKQNEALYNLDIKEQLNREMPEAIIKLNEVEFWAVESKRDKKDIEKAIKEATQDYADKINNSKKIKCVIASGIAGNDTDGFTVINKYLHNGKWETILFNNKPKDTLLSKEQVDYILKNKTINYKEFPDFPEEKYLDSAQKINEILHNAGINKNKRARFIAGLILSLSTGEEIDLRITNAELLVKNINNLIEQKLKEVKKPNFFSFINLEVPPSEENHIKYRQAIIDTLKELQTLDIKNAMASGNDILGKFYEMFLKYGNGAKEIGIVLTPRHIAQFAVDVLDPKYNDYILDPCCGTGGFLVSAFDHIRFNSNNIQIDKFKNFNLFGIEQDDEVVALALVNMIFRGDGRNNMNEGNCFQKNILKTTIDGKETGVYTKRIGESNKNPIITKVLMNPPFALKKGDEKEGRFIDYALSQMQDGGILFSILPISVLVEGAGKVWRNELLKNNTLLSVITFPEDLFNPSASVGTVGIFIKKGVPHNFDVQKVYFARATTDGFKMKKGKRIKNKNIPDRLSEIKEELKIFITDPKLPFKDIPELKKISFLEKDEKLELIPEKYIDSKIPTTKELENSLDVMTKEVLFYIMKNRMERKIRLKREENIKMVKIISICNVEKGTALPQNVLASNGGNIPYVTTSSMNNGVSEFVDEEPNFKSKCLTVALNGSVGEVFFQPEDFITNSDDAVLTLKKEYNPFLLFYIGALIKNNRWRYNYYRKLSKEKLENMLIPLPIKNGDIDLDYIEEIVKNSYGYDEIKKYLT